ncbi:TerC family protein [Candidatus Arsenophonus nilaparvatae]|uniref:TerC family protein n=1 Tax=Candidatus Arsenophonus nilaparvatae TaxID=1247023 RepID=UPI000509D9A1|nr:TerC family protein [Candidatus Arsenophonus nilaparvatae]
MHSVGTPVLWAIFTVVIAIMLLIDISLQGKHPGREITVRQAVVWSFIWISLALLFALGLWFYFKQTTSLAIANRQTMAFLTGYLLEKALAVDNVFVWLMLFNYFSIPVNLQRRVLIYGVLGAIVLRTIMIFTGSWLVSQFHWVLYLFGIFLLFTGIKMFFVKENDQSIDKKPLVKWVGSHLRMTDTLHGERFFIRQQGILFATPLIMVLILVEISDIIFAVDSIPAIFAVTTDPFIVLTSNLFAILGLRAMYFVLSGIAEKFSMLKYGLSIILIFIGIKMLLMDIFHIPTAVSLSVVAGILTLTMFINHIVNKCKKII